MSVYIALVRAVNVGGTGKLPMSELLSMCASAGLHNAKTYIASGNVAFRSDKSEAQIKAALEAALAEYAGKPVGVCVRTREDIQQVLAANPFADAAGNRVTALFLDEAPTEDAITSARNRNSESLALGKREIYVHYGEGMAGSKLVIPAATKGTSRNMNTVAKLVDMAVALG